MPNSQEYPEEIWGIEDPRLTFVPELQQYAVTYTSYSRGGPGVSLALTKDFRTFERYGVIMPPDDKDSALLPRRINGYWALIHRPMTTLGSHMWISYSPDLTHWGRHRLMLEARRGANLSLDKDSRIEGRVQIGEGVELIDSLVRGPVVIGDGTRLENAFVGPYTSIGERCTLVSCEMENSIVLADSEIRDIPLRIDGSLIGRNVRIVKTDFKPKAYRFMLGDNSEVGIT